MNNETLLFLEICEREEREIRLIDARPSVLGGSFKRMNNLDEINYYLSYSEETSRLKKKLRKMVGFWRYYFVYTFKFINAYNAYYYTR